MTDVTFTPETTSIDASWLNPINEFYNDVFDAATTKSEAANALSAITDVNSLGAGDATLVGTESPLGTANIKSLKEGNNITLTEDGNEVTISATVSAASDAVDVLYTGVGSRIDSTEVEAALTELSNEYVRIDGDTMTGALIGDLTGTATNCSRSVNAGDGLTGGGSLSGNVTLTVVGGDGITANANDIDVDSTVVRTSGSQDIAGNKTFSNTTDFTGILRQSGIRTIATIAGGKFTGGGTSVYKRGINSITDGNTNLAYRTLRVTLSDDMTSTSSAIVSLSGLGALGIPLVVGLITQISTNIIDVDVLLVNQATPVFADLAYTITISDINL